MFNNFPITLIVTAHISQINVSVELKFWCWQLIVLHIHSKVLIDQKGIVHSGVEQSWVGWSGVWVEGSGVWVDWSLCRVEKVNEVRWIGALRHFSTIFGYIWQSVSTAGGTNCSWEWTSNLPLATDNYLSWDSNPSGEGRAVSKRDAFTTLPWRSLSIRWKWCRVMYFTYCLAS